MSTRLDSSVTLVAGPPTGGSAAEGTTSFSFRGAGTFSWFEQSPFKIAAGPDVTVGLGPMTAVKALYARADTPVRLKLTHAGGADQVVPLDRCVYIECPNDPITGIKLSGTGQGVLAFVGD